MGYETALHLINVTIKDESLQIVKKALKTKKGRGLNPIVYFLREAFLLDDRLLCFKSTGTYYSAYEPDDDDGTVSVLVGKWYEADEIAQWLKLHSEKGGRLIQHSMEADGGAWGWEFDGAADSESLPFVLSASGNNQGTDDSFGYRTRSQRADRIQDEAAIPYVDFYQTWFLQCGLCPTG